MNMYSLQIRKADAWVDQLASLFKDVSLSTQLQASIDMIDKLSAGIDTRFQ